MKDVPVRPGGLAIGALLPREDPRDAFISNVVPTLEELPRAVRIGTSSVRRWAQLARARPDLEIVLLRGNVDTRLAKLDAGEYDAIILAHAGLRRLSLRGRVTSLLSLQDWLPALAQGAVGMEIRSDDRRAHRSRRSVGRHSNAGRTRLRTRVPVGARRLLPHADSWLGGLFRPPSRVPRRSTRAGWNATSWRRNSTFSWMSAAGVADAHMLGLEAGLALKPRAARWLAV